MVVLKKALNIVICLLHVLCSIAIVIAVVTMWVVPDGYSWYALIGIAFEWLICAEVVMAVYWLFTSLKRLAYISLATLLCAIVPILFTLSHGALLFGRSSSATDSFTIMSYNTHQMSGVLKPKENRVIQFLLRTEPDVVCLQEVEVSKSDSKLTLPEFRKAMEVYPYSYFDFKVYNKYRQYGNVVYSKYPLVNKHTLRYESIGNITSICDICLPDDTIRLYTNHLESNHLTQKDLDISTTEQAQTNMVHTLRKLSQASDRRSRQADALHEDIVASPYPVVVVGDFNATPVSYTYRVVHQGLRDAFLGSSNAQVGHTFVYKCLGVRIDYILHSPQLWASDFSVMHVDYSDHYPVMTTIHY